VETTGIDAPPALVQGALLFDGPLQVRGWCRRPGQPGARVAVELRVDGQLVVAMMAAQRFDGIGDGHHGFNLALPPGSANQATQLIEARDRQSGVVFGRLIRYPEHADRPLQIKISRLEQQLAEVADRVAAQRRGDATDLAGEKLSPSLSDLVGRLRYGGAGQTRAIRAELQRHLPRLRLSAAPRVSVILPRGWAMTRIASVMMAVQPLFDAVPAELLLPDDGTEPACAQLPSLMPGLRAMRVTANQPVRAMTELGLLARGEILAFVEASPPLPWRWQPVRDAGRALQIGRVRPGHGFAAVLPRALWLQIGGFDPAQIGGALWQDMATRCRLLGVPVYEI